MIDKYKRPRVQRLVPWRNPPKRSNDPQAWAEELARSILARQDGAGSGVSSSESHAQELRVAEQ